MGKHNVVTPLKVARVKNGLSQEAVARALKIPRPIYGSKERGFSEADKARLSKLLKTPVTELFDGGAS